MSLRGLPDLSAPVGTDGYRGFDEPAGVVAMPGGIALARDGDGRPRLLLERIRGIEPARPPAACALLTVWLVLTAAEPDTQAGLPGASAAGVRWRRAVPDRGVLRVRVATADPDPTEPVPMAWDGSSTAVWGTRMSAASATLIEAALGDGLLVLNAAADLEIRGVAQRLPVRAGLDWPALAGALGPACDAQGRVSRPDLVSRLRTEVLPGGSGPVRVLAGQAREDELAETLADWLGVRFARATSEIDAEPGMLVIDLDPGRAGWLEWDLSVPQLVRRAVRVGQDISLQLADLGPDLSRYVPAGRSVPPLELGWTTIDVLANVPDQQVGVLASGVDLVAPPHPAVRPQAVVASCEFTPGVRRAEAILRLSPGEDLTYRSRAWTVVQDASTTRQVYGPERSRRDRRLVLGASDFGVRLIPVSADDTLLDLADVVVALGGPHGGMVTLRRGQRDAVFVLNTDQPVAANPDRLPTLRITLRSTLDGRELTLDPLPPEPLWLGVSTIPGWGPQELTIDGRALADELIALDLRPELAEEEEATTLVLAAPERVRTWSYFARDPLHSGYLYRARLLGGAGPWLGPLAAGEPLVLAGAR